MTDESVIRVFLSIDFRRRLRTLAKRYRSIRSDLQPVIEQLKTGDIVGDQIAGTDYSVFKVRIKNSDVKKGKSAGYRLVYQLRDRTYILLVLLYSKSDQQDVTAEEINRAIAEFEKSDEL